MSGSPHSTEGRHVVADLWFAERVRDAKLVRLIDAALVRFGATVLDFSWHRFEVQGYTGLWLLSESHASLHTYPEHRYASIDIYACGAADPEAMVAWLLGELGPAVARSEVAVLRRGVGPR